MARLGILSSIEVDEVSPDFVFVFSGLGVLLIFRYFILHWDFLLWVGVCFLVFFSWISFWDRSCSRGSCSVGRPFCKGFWNDVWKALIPEFSHISGSCHAQRRCAWYRFFDSGIAVVKSRGLITMARYLLIKVQPKLSLRPWEFVVFW